VLRVETDSDGVYETHLRTADGQRVTVEVGKDFTVTGLEAAPAGHRRPAARLAARSDDRPARGRVFLGPIPGHAGVMRQVAGDF
jgi:hypothetical protein